MTRPGGLLLVYAWSFEQEEGSRRQFETQDCFVPWHMPTSFDAKHTSESSGQEAASESNVATDLHEKQQSVGSSSDAPSPSGIFGLVAHVFIFFFRRFINVFVR